MTDDSRPINPFTSAKRMATVLVSYRAEDAMDDVPTLSKAKADTFVTKHSIVIAHAMLAAATAIVRKLAEGEKDDE